MQTLIPPKNSLFVDTSGWADPILQNSPFHASMDAYAKQLIGSLRPLVTTNYVILELVALITARRGIARPQLIQLVNQIKRLPQIHVVHVDPATDDEAWATLERFTDKRWSQVDAASFVIMKRFGLTEAFTSDDHFTQAGFIRVPQVP